MILPSLFISHGSPMLALQDSPAHRALGELGRSLPRPEAILVVSAHWETLGGVAVSLAPRPETIHDFGGFPGPLYDLEYPAPGAYGEALRAATLLEQTGFSVKRNPERGLDHGAWVPLWLMYPDADIPVAQISLRHNAPPAEHVRMGQALRPLRDEGVLIVGSGAMTHNLYAFRGQPIDTEAPHWVTEFTDWVHGRLVGAQYDTLLDYRMQAPYAQHNHPTDEHLMPLFVALGAGGEAPRAERVHASYEYGVIAMDAYAFS
jgi:4,5-DOPA dioxygenase extradiol